MKIDQEFCEVVGDELIKKKQASHPDDIPNLVTWNQRYSSSSILLNPIFPCIEDELVRQELANDFSEKIGEVPTGINASPFQISWDIWSAGSSEK